jgi:hypothetical protein
MSDEGAYLALILSAWTEMLRRGETGPLAAILHENVVWQGIQPEQICGNREEVLDLLVRNRRRPPRLTRIEAEEFGDRVAVSVNGPDFPENENLAAGAPRSLVFTFSDGKVVRMESFASREAAFARADPANFTA